jgi:dihydroflavonol-4-reductase
MTLVTGGTGFIGGHLLDKLCALGEPVRCLLRRRAAPRALPPGVEPAYGDLSTGQGVADALRGAGTVIHLAGVIKAVRPLDFYDGNVRATETLVRMMAGNTARLVHVSSLAAAGPSLHEPIDEDREPHPVSHYGKSKLDAEKVVRSLSPDAVIVRPPVVYGPRDTGVFQLLKSIPKGWAMEIAGGQLFSFIYVADLVDGLIAAAHHPRAAGRTYFLAHPKPVSWAELNATAASIIGRKPRVIRIPATVARAVGYCADVWSRITGKPGMVSREKVLEAQLCWTCDTRRAAAELGFQARTPLETGLALTLAWYKEAGWLTY